MKKILLAFICLFTLFGLTACGESDYYNENETLIRVEIVVPEAELIEKDINSYVYFLDEDKKIANDYFEKYINFLKEEKLRITDNPYDHIEKSYDLYNSDTDYFIAHIYFYEKDYGWNLEIVFDKWKDAWKY